MSKAAQSHELTYDLIKRADHGDQEAIEAYLLHYDAYINFLVSYDEVGPDGRILNIPPQTGQQNGGNRSRVTVEMSPGVRLQVQAVE